MTKTEVIGTHYKMKFVQCIYSLHFIVFNELPSGVQVILPRIITEQIYKLLKNRDWHRLALDFSMPCVTFCIIKFVLWYINIKILNTVGIVLIKLHSINIRMVFKNIASTLIVTVNM